MFASHLAPDMTRGCTSRGIITHTPTQVPLAAPCDPLAGFPFSPHKCILKARKCILKALSNSQHWTAGRAKLEPLSGRQLNECRHGHQEPHTHGE